MIRSFFNSTYRYFVPIKIYLHYLCENNTTFHISEKTKSCTNNLCCIKPNCLFNSYIGTESNLYLYKKVLVLNPLETTVFNISNFSTYDFIYSFDHDKIMLNNRYIEYDTNYFFYRDVNNQLYYLHITRKYKSDEDSYKIPYDIIIRIIDI